MVPEYPRGGLDCLDIPQSITLVHYIDDSMLSRSGDQEVEVDAFERPMRARQRRHKTHESSETSPIDKFRKEQCAVAGEDNFS